MVLRNNKLEHMVYYLNYLQPTTPRGKTDTELGAWREQTYADGTEPKESVKKDIKVVWKENEFRYLLQKVAENIQKQVRI